MSSSFDGFTVRCRDGFVTFNEDDVLFVVPEGNEGFDRVRVEVSKIGGCTFVSSREGNGRKITGFVDVVDVVDNVCSGPFVV